MSICHEVDATPSWQLVLSALLLILLPEALAFGLFSSMGFAANIASFAADSQAWQLCEKESLYILYI